MVHAGPADDGLRARALDGDERAFEALIAPLVEPGLRLAYAMLGDHGEAEDALQEAVTRAWRKLHQLKPGMPARPWFLAIVGNHCRNLRRTRWFRLVRLPEVQGAGVPAGDPVQRLDVARALARLRVEDRQALFLYFYLDLALPEVAAALGVSEAAAKGRIYRACRKLRPGLEEDSL